jgi:hypothetical protein
MSAAPSMLAVYDGQTCVGFILARGRVGFEGFDAGERSLGVFETQDEAANKITGQGNERNPQ